MKYFAGLGRSMTALGVCIALGTGVAQADIVTPVGAGGSLVLGLTWSASGSGMASPATMTGNPTTATGPVTVSDLTSNPASNYLLSNTIAAANGSFASGTINGQEYNFVDTYVIDVPTSTASAYIFSLNLTSELGIQNLSTRLYTYSAGSVQNLTIGATGGVSGPVAGSWSSDMNGVVASTQLQNLSLSSGEYVLQVVGLETGTVSGTYNGSLALTPVPLPAGLPFFLSGLAGLTIWRRRR